VEGSFDFDDNTFPRPSAEEVGADNLELPGVPVPQVVKGLFSAAPFDADGIFPRPSIALPWVDKGRAEMGRLFVGGGPVLPWKPLVEEGLSC